MSGGPPKRNQAYTFYVYLPSQQDPNLMLSNPTIVAGDVKVAIDDAAPANITTLPTVDADFPKRVKVQLSAAEMSGVNVSLLFSDAADAEWGDVGIHFQTSVHQLDDLGTGGGSVEYTVGVDDGVTPLEGVSVWVTRNSDGTDLAASGTTDVFGSVTFMLDPGDYYLWKQLSGYNFVNGRAITVPVS